MTPEDEMNDTPKVQADKLFTVTHGETTNADGVRYVTATITGGPAPFDGSVNLGTGVFTPAKSLGEKLTEALGYDLPLRFAANREFYEVAALRFTASLSHDETTTALLAARDERIERLEGALRTIASSQPGMGRAQAVFIAQATLKEALT